MSTGLIDYLKDVDGKVIYPVTSIQSIYDTESGKSLKEILDGKLNTSGGTMTGNIVYNMYNLEQEYLDWPGPVNVYTGNQWGLDVYFGGGGTTIVGAGESSHYLASDFIDSGTVNDETLYLTADQGITMYVGANAWENKKKLIIDTNLNIYPEVNAQANMGTSSKKFGVMYANTFDGTATLSKALTVDNAFYFTSNKLSYFNAELPTGCAVGVNDSPSGAWNHILRFSHSNSEKYYTDIAIPISTGRKNISYKMVQMGSIVSGNWITLLDSQNYSTYTAPKTHTHNYLPLTGGTLTGDLNFNLSGINGLTISAYKPFPEEEADTTTFAAIKAIRNLSICSGNSYNYITNEKFTDGIDSIVLSSLDSIVFCVSYGHKYRDPAKCTFDPFLSFYPNKDKQGTLGVPGYRWNQSYIWTQYTNKTNTISADYAELFEWDDGNVNLEDRRGYFVTFTDGEKIRIANSKDSYILGVVSGQPSIVGNHDLNEWQGKYVRDQFGTLQKDYDNNSNNIENLIINPDYDENMYYRTREERPEWDPIGMLGVIRVRDDGSCVPGEYCTVDNYGRATRSKWSTGYRVLSRINDEIIKILFR